VVHDIYKWHESQETPALKRRNSDTDVQSLLAAAAVSQSHSNADEDEAPLRARDLRQPGMFRRAFLATRQPEGRPLPSVITRNFIDFLVLYGFYGIYRSLCL
jgi:hypothetical protein